MTVVNKSGRRKTSVARVYLCEGSGEIIINEYYLKDYFKTSILQGKVVQPLVLTQNEKKLDIQANVSGGGTTGQAEALRLAIAKSLVEINPEYKSILRKEGLITRDSRMVERKKPGQKKARKRFQFSKR